MDGTWIGTAPGPPELVPFQQFGEMAGLVVLAVQTGNIYQRVQ